MSEARMRTVLSIAGSDPSGGAGIQADLKTFAAFGVDGCAAIAALTAQNERDVFGVLDVPADFLARQITAVLDDREVDAVKVGMLGTAANVRCVASVLREAGTRNLVVDPVLRATSGPALLDESGLDALRTELVPLATVLTPNALEAGALLGTSAPGSVGEMHDAARALSAFGAEWILVTGGHVDAESSDCVDVLFGGRDVLELRTARVPGAGIHGSGCRLSSAIASLLALGASVPDACAQAQQFVARAVAVANARSLVEAI
jgi:hydroxymethylpyrimidine/phosphomethylpyrimidine kinase